MIVKPIANNRDILEHIQNSDLSEHLDHIAICGGFALNCLGYTDSYSDIDVYFTSKSKLLDFVAVTLEDQNSGWRWVSESQKGNVITLRFDEIDASIQCIWWGSRGPQSIFDTFDLNIAKAGIQWKDEEWQGVIDNSLKNCITDREIIVKIGSTIANPIKTAHRIAKYNRRFYKPLKISPFLFSHLFDVCWNSLTPLQKDEAVFYAENSDYEEDRS